MLQIKKGVDFSFAEEETEDLYSEQMGRPVYPGGVLFRMLYLEFYGHLSDVEVASQVQCNSVYRAKKSPINGATAMRTFLLL